MKLSDLYDELSGKTTGYTLTFHDVEIVLLNSNGKNVAYRKRGDTEWSVGSPADAFYFADKGEA